MIRSALVAAITLMPLATGPAAQESDYAAVKCSRYRQAWADLTARRGVAGLSPAFIERHDAFLASGCTGVHDVCPRAPAELDVANALVMMAMNAGMASTFPPFGCPK